MRNKNPKVDYLGVRFGKLIVIGKSRDFKNRFVWKCLCDCGKETPAYSIQLSCKKKSSCGCGRSKLPKGEGSFNALHSSYVIGANKRNLKFQLSKDEFKKLTKSNCFYCGLSPSTVYDSSAYNGHYIYNGVDRVDNSKGYEPNNCVPCCATCNKAKNTHSQEDFIHWILRVYNKTIMKSDFYKFEHRTGVL